MTTVKLYDYIQSELFKQGFNYEFVDHEGNLVFFDDNHQTMNKILKFDDDVQNIVNKLFLNNALKDISHDYHFKKSFMMRFLDREINTQTIESFMMVLNATFLTHEHYINEVYKNMELYLTQTGLNEQLGTQISKQVSKQVSEQLSKSTNTTTNEDDSITNTTGSHTQNSLTDDNSTQSTQNKDNSTQRQDTRNAKTTLPQNTVNLNVENNTLSTANENDISIQKNTQNGTSESNVKNNGSSENNTTGNNKSQTTTNSTGRSDGETDSTVNGTVDGENNSQSDNEVNVLTKSYQFEQLFKSKNIHDNILDIFDVKCFLQVW